MAYCRHGHELDDPPSKYGCRECDRIRKRERYTPRQRQRRDLSERLYCKTSKGDGCWNWTGHKDRKGYGRILVGRDNRRAHRVAWELENWPIPKGKLVCHRCDNPSCIRPDHLFLATNDENMADMVAKGRARNGTTARRMAQ